jgi:hypothetical protein
MEQTKALTKPSLIGAATAAYVGAWLLFAIDLFWRIRTGADARICPPGSQDPTDLCTIAEVAGAFLFVFLWALYGLPFALVLTVVPALVLGRFAPTLESKFEAPTLNVAQYALGAAIGALVMLLFAIATSDDSVAVLTLAGFIAGVSGVWAFRRSRYGH